MTPSVFFVFTDLWLFSPLAIERKGFFCVIQWAVAFFCLSFFFSFQVIRYCFKVYNQILCGKCSQFYNKNTIECHSPVILYPLSLFKKHMFTCTQDSWVSSLSGLRCQQPEGRPTPGSPQRYTIKPAAASPAEENTRHVVLCARWEKSQIEHSDGEYAQKSKYIYYRKQLFMCPNKLHKDFSNREREEDQEEGGGMRGGQGRSVFFSLECAPMTFLCLILCAISRCIIYFCVKSLTAVICHYDDTDDGASFSRHADVTLVMAPTTI